MPFKPPICMRFETVFAPTLTTLLMSPVGQPSVAASNSEPIVANDHAVRCVLCVRCWDSHGVSFDSIRRKTGACDRCQSTADATHGALHRVVGVCVHQRCLRCSSRTGAHLTVTCMQLQSRYEHDTATELLAQTRGGGDVSRFKFLRLTGSLSTKYIKPLRVPLRWRRPAGGSAHGCCLPVHSCCASTLRLVVTATLPLRERAASPSHSRVCYGYSRVLPAELAEHRGPVEC